MAKSATALGKDYNLSSQEMNYVLKKQGFLDGAPGDYSVTNKGRAYAETKDFHRGTGGYSIYNRHYSTRSWDESIKDELDITDEIKAEARAAIADARRQKAEERKVARAAANAAFLEAYNNRSLDEDEDEDSFEDDSTMSGREVLYAGAILLLACGVSKAAPHVKKWWTDSISPKLHNGKNKIPCPVCGAVMSYKKKSKMWVCRGCNHKIDASPIVD